MKRFFILLVIIALSILLISCSTTDEHHSTPKVIVNTSIPPDPDELTIINPAITTTTPTEATIFGEVQNGVYINELLGITAKFPEGWESLSQDVLLRNNKLFVDILDYHDFNNFFKYRDAVLIAIAQSIELDTSIPDHAFRIMLSVENENWTPEYIDKAFQSTIDSMNRLDTSIGSSSDVFIDDDVEANGVNYNHIHIETNNNGQIIHQQYFITGVKEFVLYINFGYSDDYTDVVEKTITTFLSNIRYDL